MSQNSDWAKRRAAIDQELGGHESNVADVRIVQVDSFRTSRERGSCARHFGSIAAPAAGHQNGIRIDAIDGSSASQRTVMVAVHQITISAACTIFLCSRTAVTHTQTEITALASLDPDPLVRPRLFEVDFTTANVPTGPSATIIACQTVFQAYSNFTPPAWLPGAIWFDSSADRSLYLVNNTAASAIHYTVEWQGIRR